MVILAMRNSANISDPLGPAWFEEVMRDFTALGGIAVLTALSVAVIGFLLLQKKKKMALFRSLFFCKSAAESKRVSIVEQTGALAAGSFMSRIPTPAPEACICSLCLSCFWSRFRN